MSNHGGGNFIDYFICPTCHKPTPFYARTTHAERNRVIRDLFCGECGLLRVQTKNSIGWNFGQKDQGVKEHDNP